MFVYYFIIIFPGQYNAMAASGIIDLKGGKGLDPFYLTTLTFLLKTHHFF
jgi:hypothetical protein